MAPTMGDIGIVTGESSIRRALLCAVTVSLVVSACSIIPTRKPIGPSPAPPRPTPTPGPLIRVAGAQPRYDSHIFFGPTLGWIAKWRYDCHKANQKTWTVSILAAHDHIRQKPPRQVIVLAGTRHRLRARLANGSVHMTITGTLYILIRASRGCSWSLRALPWT